MAKQPRILTGQVVAITGGARGIGRAMAEAFLREGMRVAIGDVDQAAATQTAQELGRGTIALELDVTRRESVQQFADDVESQLGPIAVVGLSEALRGELRNMEAAIDISVVMPNIVGTELTTGVGASRAAKVLTPEEVAEATLEALQFGRFDVWVPKSAQTISTVTNVFPRRAREAVGRALKADRIIWDADMNARKNYELRAARSEPGLEAGGQEQLPEKTAS